MELISTTTTLVARNLRQRSKTNFCGRIVACDMVSDYDSPMEEKHTIRNLFEIVAKKGFFVGSLDVGPKYSEEFGGNFSKWVEDGSLKVLMSVTDGLRLGQMAMSDIKGGEHKQRQFWRLKLKEAVVAELRS